MSEDDLKLREDEMLYPPMFVIKVRGSSSAENSKVIFTFEGATEKIVKEVILTKGILGTQGRRHRGGRGGHGRPTF